MTRKQFNQKVFDLTNQLRKLVKQLPEIPELETVLDDNLFDKSKNRFELSIFGLEDDLELISDKYFDKAENL
jgi:hypothetical protein